MEELVLVFIEKKLVVALILHSEFSHRQKQSTGLLLFMLQMEVKWLMAC